MNCLHLEKKPNNIWVDNLCFSLLHEKLEAPLRASYCNLMKDYTFSFFLWNNMHGWIIHNITRTVHWGLLWLILCCHPCSQSNSCQSKNILCEHNQRSDNAVNHFSQHFNNTVTMIQPVRGLWHVEREKEIQGSRGKTKTSLRNEKEGV